VTETIPATVTPGATDTAIPDATATGSAPTLVASLGLDPADWKNWPVLPIVPEHAREIYLLGQSLGNDPHAFSVFGDCQSEPDVFMGVYETDPAQVVALTPELQKTVAWFTGSFNRESPTVKGGTTTGALLWAAWHENKYTCQDNESPVTCELRIHKPSFVIIHIGTHYEARDEDYMRKIIDQVIAAGVVPILTTKGDNRGELTDTNASDARLAVEYNIPLWNFWASLDGLPDRGLYTKRGEEFLGNIYLNTDAQAIHRLSALQALDTVWRAVTNGQ
jgi:hypothetical protein